MNSKALALLGKLDQLLIYIYNALNEGNPQKAALAVAGFHSAMGLILKGIRDRSVKLSDEFVSGLESRQQEFSKYLDEVQRLNAETPMPPTQHLYEIVIEAAGRPNEGFDVCGHG